MGTNRPRTNLSSFGVPSVLEIEAPGDEFAGILCDCEAQGCVDKKRPLGLTWASWIKSTFPLSIFQMHFNIILLSTAGLSFLPFGFSEYNFTVLRDATGRHASCFKGRRGRRKSLFTSLPCAWSLLFSACDLSRHTIRCKTYYATSH